MVNPQVKKRAVLDLLAGLKREGLSHARVSTPSQMWDMLHVLALPQPFSGDVLAGTDAAWLLRDGDDDSELSALRQVLQGAEHYHQRSLCELVRLRLEAGAPASRDVTRRETEVGTEPCVRCGSFTTEDRFSPSFIT